MKAYSFFFFTQVRVPGDDPGSAKCKTSVLPRVVLMICFVCVFVYWRWEGGLHPVVLRAYSWLWAQASLLADLGDHEECQGLNQVALCYVHYMQSNCPPNCILALTLPIHKSTRIIWNQLCEQPSEKWSSQEADTPMNHTIQGKRPPERVCKKHKLWKWLPNPRP